MQFHGWRTGRKNRNKYRHRALFISLIPTILSGTSSLKEAENRIHSPCWVHASKKKKNSPKPIADFHLRFFSKYVSNGACDIEFDRADIQMNKLLVSTLEGKLRVYDLRTLHPELGYAYVEDRISTGTVWCSKGSSARRIERSVCLAMAASDSQQIRTSPPRSQVYRPSSRRPQILTFTNWLMKMWKMCAAFLSPEEGLPSPKLVSAVLTFPPPLHRKKETRKNESSFQKFLDTAICSSDVPPDGSQLSLELARLIQTKLEVWSSSKTGVDRPHFRMGGSTCTGIKTGNSGYPNPRHHFMIIVGLNLI